ncbi:thioesterase II family protein [Xenorhabdus sp. SGI246]|uniref:thioesterase II family protein n=1 Tax=Xenorhabdus sp. SGI246 TaxID=3158263 RepID=UPI00349FB21A
MTDSILYPAFERAEAKVQLVFLHHAGGSSYSYLQLSQKLSGFIETYCMELAGRGSRFIQPFQTDAETVISDLLASINRLKLGEDKPLLLFGHSLGAELAYHVARRLKSEAPEKKLGLMLSARGTSAPDDLRNETLSEAEIIGLLKAFEQTPQDVFTHPELRKYVVNAMRSDLRLLASLSRLPKPMINCQAYVIGADHDEHVPVPWLTQWREIFATPVTQKVFAGEHFYLFSSDEVIDWIEERARELAA